MVVTWGAGGRVDQWENKRVTNGGKPQNGLDAYLPGLRLYLLLVVPNDGHAAVERVHRRTRRRTQALDGRLLETLCQRARAWWQGC